jgi:hypothetical protein
VQAQIEGTGGGAQGTLTARIYGPTMGILNAMSRAGIVTPGAAQGRATVLLAAGNDGETLSTAYEGVLMSAVPVFTEADNFLNVYGLSGAVAALRPVGASSYIGATPVAQIMQDLADEAGFAFENSGVATVLSNPYFPGTTLAKIQSCARAAGIFYAIENNVLAIWPGDGWRKTTNQAVISPGAGLVGYPSFDLQSLTIRTLFRPNTRLGETFTLAGSQVDVANGDWGIWGYSHTLDAQTPNGAWFTDIIGSKAYVNQGSAP